MSETREALQQLYDAVAESHQPFFWDKTIRAALDNAKAALALPSPPQSAPEGWHDISTAPKDGSRILLFREDWMESAAVGFWHSDFHEWQPVNGSCFPGPTHWMLLPDPPSDVASRPSQREK